MCYLAHLWNHVVDKKQTNKQTKNSIEESLFGFIIQGIATLVGGSMAQEQLMAEETGTYSPLDELDTRDGTGTW